MDALTTVCALIAQMLNVTGDNITVGTTLEELNMDSLDTMELIMTVEEEFDVLIEDNSAIKCVGDLLEQIEKQRCATSQMKIHTTIA